MSRIAEAMPRSPFPTEHGYHASRHIPILPSSLTSTNFTSPGMMDMTPPASAVMGPPSNSSPEMEHDGGNNVGTGEQAATTNGISVGSLSAAAAASSQQPKVVQTAFIHKLYNMLEDPNIQNLISWSSSNESFVMSPSTEFSKVLSQYFKHTNISSFVRQLNMYGFHKVSDVFHTGAPDSTLWEFKHGNGNFKRGDLAGLREIKRRASRHALIHRDSFSSPQHKPSGSQPGTPAEPAPETSDQRLANIEHSLYEMHTRLMRTEESNTALSSKCSIMGESLARCHTWNNDLAHIIMKMIPDQDSQLYRDLATCQREIAKQSEMIRTLDDPHESLLSGRQPFFANMVIDNVSLSPRQTPQDERRSSAHNVAPRPSFFRPPVPAHLNISPRRYGSIGTATQSPNHVRSSISQQHPPPPTQHPLASVSEPGMNMGRRHTSADIRNTDGWPPHSGSPFESGHNSTNWPSSPNRTPSVADQQVRDALASYQIGGPSRPQFEPGRQITPPSTHDNPPPSGPVENGWGFGSGGPKFPPRLLDSAPQTRRSSMASNVHSLLNPAETAERDEEEGFGEERKRKRVI